VVACGVGMLRRLCGNFFPMDVETDQSAASKSWKKEFRACVGCKTGKSNKADHFKNSHNFLKTGRSSMGLCGGARVFARDSSSCHDGLFFENSLLQMHSYLQ